MTEPVKKRDSIKKGKGAAHVNLQKKNTSTEDGTDIIGLQWTPYEHRKKRKKGKTAGTGDAFRDIDRTTLPFPWVGTAPKERENTA